MCHLKSVIIFLVLLFYIFLLNAVIDFRSDHVTSSVKSGHDYLSLPWSEDPLVSLSKLASWPPDTPVNASCSPPQLPPTPSCQGQPGLTGEMLTRPRRVVLMMMFSFEVDTLEISLREQMDWVDKIFIVEATTTTKGVRMNVLTNVDVLTVEYETILYLIICT